MTLLRIALFGSALLASGVSWGGIGIVGGGGVEKIHSDLRLPVLRGISIGGSGPVQKLNGGVIGLKWTGRHGRVVTVPLPAPRPLDDLGALPCPAGEWVELTLILEDGLTLSADEATRVLAVDQLDLVLVEPVTGGAPLALALTPLTLEAADWALGDDALRGRLEDLLLLDASTPRP